jgi:hypothetical protein
VDELPGWKSGSACSASEKPLALQNASAAGLPQLVAHCRHTSSRLPSHTGFLNTLDGGIGFEQVIYAKAVHPTLLLHVSFVPIVRVAADLPTTSARNTTTSSNRRQLQYAFAAGWPQSLPNPKHQSRRPSQYSGAL